jgi:hypothetical protein
VYAQHHPAAIGLPYPPRPGSGSGLRPKPFIAKGPVLAADAVPEGEKKEFEPQSEGEKGEFEVQVAAVEVEVDDEGLRQEQGEGEGEKTLASAGPHISSIKIYSRYHHTMPCHPILCHVIPRHTITFFYTVYMHSYSLEPFILFCLTYRPRSSTCGQSRCRSRSRSIFSLAH